MMFASSFESTGAPTRRFRSFLDVVGDAAVPSEPAATCQLGTGPLRCENRHVATKIWHSTESIAIACRFEWKWFWKMVIQ